MAQAIALDANLAPADWISVNRAQGPADFGSTLMRIVAASRTGPLSIAGDHLRLSRGPGNVSFWDYTRLRLFDREFWAGEDRRRPPASSSRLH